MDINTQNIQVLLQAAEFVDRRDREAEHGYASFSTVYHTALQCKRSKQKRNSPDRTRSVHNELEKHRRAQLKQCLEQLKQQIPLSSDSVRNTTLNLLRHARLHIKKLQEQDEQAERVKDCLRWKQRGLRFRLEQLLGNAERVRSDSQGSTMSSEKSDSEREDMEIDVENTVFVCFKANGTAQTDGDHSYSITGPDWL